MAPELLETDIRRLVHSRMREGMLPPTTVAIPHGFVIVAGRNEVDVAGFHAHERCAVIWREESDRLL
jgi:hypothetical protein